MGLTAVPDATLIENIPGLDRRFAGQCCDENGTMCYRRFDNTTRDVSSSNSDCINGVGASSNLWALSYEQNMRSCAVRGLTLCKVSCAGRGCNYNRHPVLTQLPCEN